MARQYPVSLANPSGATANDRRARANVDVNSSADSDPSSSSDGFPTRYAKYLNISIVVNDTGRGCDWELWVYDGNAEIWYLDTSLGSSGTVTLATSDADYPVYGNTVELSGLAQRVYIKLDNATGGAMTNGVDVWLSGVGEAS